MNNWAEPFRQRLQLLTDLLPVVAAETRFALKGGTAINLFEHDLPRLSVDVDLTWLPVGDFAGDSKAIDEALRGIARALAAPPLRLQVATSAPEPAQAVTRLIATRGRARVQIETTPVMRGVVHPVRVLSVQPRVRDQFGFAEMQVLHFNDLYGGKLAAALTRQNPRDLFDVGILLDEGRFDVALWRTFLVYLTASPKPAWELLEPGEPRDLAVAFRTVFEGMTAEPTTLEALLENRARMLARIGELMDAPTRAFLISVENERPDFDLIGLPQAADLPGVRRKLQNLARRSPEKRAADLRQLTDTLDRIGRKDTA
jgi:predicted nucleotidyltransferase component of viral defense system